MAETEPTNACPFNGVSDDLLSCLNSWPDGTVGYYKEKDLIKVLNILCKKYGYGRVPQLCEQIRDIWYDENKVKLYQKKREERLELLEFDRKLVEANNEKT